MLNFPLVLNIKTMEHLFLNLGYSADFLNHIILHKEDNVKELTIKKFKNGKVKERLVYKTSPNYKNVLRAINHKLLRKACFPYGVLGGVVGKNINDMIQIHCGKEAVFLMDLKDFFPSITSGRIFDLFLRTGCCHKVAGLLTDLATYQGILPQGFPTSPTLANLIAFDLDVQHLLKCQTENISRTRWIDDIVFSGRSYALEKNVKDFIGIVKRCGFKVNNKKTKFLIRHERPIICGLEMHNRHPRVPFVVIDTVRNILQSCLIIGVRETQADYELGLNRSKNFKQSLQGRIRYIAKYNKKEGVELFRLYNQIDWEATEKYKGNSIEDIFGE
jgi:RNA-directed DNA polymerase